MFYRTLPLLWVCMFFFSCASYPPPPVEPQPTPSVSQPQPQPKEEPVPVQPPAPPQNVESAPAEPPTPVELTKPKQEETTPIIVKVEDQSISITEEEYQKTFKEVEQVIDELNSIIKAGDYAKWERYLTPKFIASVMDPEYLKRLNEQPLLKRNRIEIKTLHDYFMYVVVPSRASVRLDDLIFTDQNKVKAFMFVRQDPVLIYQLEKIGETWKISVW